MSLLIVIPFNSEQAEQAEKLCDFCYFIQGKVQGGHCLLIADKGVHDEMKLKVKLSAEVAFENVNIAVTGGNLFSEASKLISQNYKSPWLWMETDCIPLKVGWISALQDAYNSQPKKYMGAFYKNEALQMFLGRNSIYPAEERSSAIESDVTSYATKTKLIQLGKYDGIPKIRPDAVLFCSDKTGALMNDLKMLKGNL